MKKIFVVAICVLAVLCVGCGGEKSANTNQSSSVQQEAPVKSEKQLKFEAEAKARKDAFEKGFAETQQKQAEIRQYINK